MTGKSLKFGFHDFINAQPLLIPLREKAQQLNVTLITGSPAGLAEQLRTGELDLAMIPSIEYLKDLEQYRLLPGVAVASRGPVGTVLLVSRQPLEKVQSIALDIRSRTSAALLQVLFADTFSADISLEPGHPEPEIMLKEHDAALIIGDPAFGLRSAYPDLQFYDLSEQWFEQTGKTFVHAVVAVRRGVELNQEFLKQVEAVKQEGLSRVESIAQSESKRAGIAYATCLDYLSSKIIYHLGPEEMNGLRHFQEVCFEKKILDKKEIIRFVEV